MDNVSKGKEELTEVASQVHSKCNQRGTDDDERRDIMIISARGRLVKGSEICFRRVPFLNPILDGRFAQEKDGDGNILLDIDPESFYACIAYADSAFTQQSLLLTNFFRECNVRELTSTADYLGIDIPIISTIEELLDLEKTLRNSDDYRSARDSAAKLCFSIAKKSIRPFPNFSHNNNGPPIRQPGDAIRHEMITAMYFIMRRPNMFGPRLRTHVWTEFEKVVTLTDWQRKKQFGFVTDYALKRDYYDPIGKSLYSSGDGETKS